MNYLKDHLGNIRVTVDEQGSVVTADDYYPFGMQMPGRSYNVAFSGNQYKFGSKELDDENNLNWYHFEARRYDPVIARFTTIDPHASRYPDLSPYVYVGNNPIRFMDPTGMDSTESNSSNGTNSSESSTKPATVAPLIITTVVKPITDTKPIPVAAASTALKVVGSALGVLLSPKTMGDATLKKPLNSDDVDNQVLVRLGKAYQDENKLGAQAAAAEKVPRFGHGVSALSPSDPGAQGKVYTTATVLELLNAGFNVKPTPTRANPGHYTVMLPKPVTPEDAARFNAVFKRNPK